MAELKKTIQARVTRNEKTDIKDLRQRWADLCNSHLEKHQIDSRIDMRSYKEQGIDKEPEKNYYQAKPKTLKSGKPCNSHVQPIKSLSD